MLALLQEIGCQGKSSRLISHCEKLKDHQLAALDQAKHFITANFRQELSLAEIARHCHVSVFHFSRLFKQFTSRSPYQFLIDVRLRHAALLLRHTFLPVTQICFESGFNSFEHFILSFTKHYGRSPSKYRRQKSKIP
jgi:transcriptional regulator GlxA family with amidase domain